MKKRTTVITVLIFAIVLTLFGCSSGGGKASLSITVDSDYEYSSSHSDQEVRSYMHVFYSDSRNGKYEVHDYTLIRNEKNGGVVLTVEYNGLSKDYRLVAENKYVSIVARRSNSNVVFSDFTENDIKNTVAVYGITADGVEDKIYNYDVIIEQEFYTGGDHVFRLHYKGLYCEITINLYGLKCYINFDTMSDLTVDSILVDRKSPAPELPTLTRPGYIFHGWKLDGEYYTKGTTVEEDITLIADWEAIAGHVTFKINGATIYEQDYTGDGKDVNVPKVPKKTGYDGKWEDYQLSGGDTIVNAVYTPKTYTITFDYKGATGEYDVLTKTVTYDQPIGELPEPVKEGEIFCYWYVSPSGYRTQVDADTPWTWDANLNIYAWWLTDTNYVWPAPDLTYKLNDDKASYTITGFGEETAAMTRFRIPAEYNSLPVTAIGMNAFSKHTNAIYVKIEEGITEISSSAFSGSSSLKTVILPESLKSIGQSAFSGTAITSIKIPSAVKSIGTFAFNGLKNMKTVEIDPNGALESIGLKAFLNCSALTEIVIPKKLNYIDETAFAGCDSLTKVYIYDLVSWCSITFVDDYSNPLYGPADLYYNGEKIVNLRVPASLTKISDRAFVGYDSLQTVVFEDGSLTTEIGTWAFAFCDDLDSVRFAGSVSLEKIGYAAFNNSNLTYFEMPESLAELRANSFNIPPDTIKIRDISSWLSMSFAGSMLLSYTNIIGPDGSRLTHLVVPSEITSIPAYAFCNYRYLETVTFEEGSCLESIGAHAFEDSSIKSIILPNSLKTIGEKAFYNCVQLTGINLVNVTTINDYAFADTPIASLTIPKSVTRLGEGAFANCSSLAEIIFADDNLLEEIPDFCFIKSPVGEITLPESVTSIGYETFSGCANLTAINLDHVIEITSYAFYNCVKLYTVDNGVYYIGEWAVGYNEENVTSVTIKDGTRFIASYMFSNRTNLKSVIIPSSVERLHESMFWGCISLHHITVPFIGETLETQDADKPLPFGFFFGTDTYSDYTVCPQEYYDPVSGTLKVKNYRIPTSLNFVRVISGIIPYNAFKGMPMLDEVSIGDTVTEIGSYAFYKCTALTDLTFEGTSVYGNAINRIGEYAFYGCTVLRNMNGNIPEKVTRIEDYTFYNCQNLFINNIYLPNVTYIGDYAFAGCREVYHFVSYGRIQYIGASAFGGCNHLESFEMSYESECTYIGDEAFFACTALTSFCVPYNAVLGENVFMNCSSITSFYSNSPGEHFRVVDGIIYDRDMTTLLYYPLGRSGAFEIPSGILKIEDYAFYSSSGLTAVTIPSSLEEIGETAFGYCENLTSVTFAGTSNLKVIGDDGFNGAGIRNIRVPQSVEYIGSYAFDPTKITISFEDNTSDWKLTKSYSDPIVIYHASDYQYERYYDYNWQKIIP